MANVVGVMREGRWSRKVCFDTLNELCQSQHVAGVRASFFTKLIYFCAPAHDGYILDSRVQASLNVLLTNARIDRNAADGEAYDRACVIIEDLSDIRNSINLKGATVETPERTEMRLFGDKLWRALVERLAQEHR